MSEAIVVEHCAGLSAHGPLDTTVSALLEGSSAITSESPFGVPVTCALFPNSRWRAPATCARELAEQLGHARLPHAPDLFVYCAAKGDLRGIDQLPGTSHDISPPSSPLLSEQSEMFCRALDIRPKRSLIVSNACASGAIGLEMALEMMTGHHYDTAVVVGFDPLSRFVSTGFHALGALSSSVARPFDRTRDGLSLGEGAAVAVLVRRTPEKGDICLDGAGSSNDANHRTGPSRTGEGLLRAARMALETADLAPENVGAVKCHGTATLYNDAMEAKALQALFGNTIPPCASFKGALGHTSGGGALLEVLIASHLLRARTLAPTVGFAELGVEEPIPISATKQAFSTPSLLCLSAGFGGVNAAIALSETCS